MKPWQTETVIVQGRKFTFDDLFGGKLYHGSPRKLPVGTVLVPQQEQGRNFAESPTGHVCFTSDYTTATYWARKALNDMTAPVWVYEIEPHTNVIVHRAMPANYGKNFQLLEGRTETATITNVHHV